MPPHPGHPDPARPPWTPGPRGGSGSRKVYKLPSQAVEAAAVANERAVSTLLQFHKNQLAPPLGPLGPSALGRGYWKVLVKCRLCQPLGWATRVIYWEETQAGKQDLGRRERHASLPGRIFPLWLFVPCEFMKCLWCVRRCAGRGQRKTVALLYVVQPPAGLTLRSLDLLTRGWQCLFSPLWIRGWGEVPGRVAESGLSWFLSYRSLCISRTQTWDPGGLEEPVSLIFPGST